MNRQDEAFFVVVVGSLGAHTHTNQTNDDGSDYDTRTKWLDDAANSKGTEEDGVPAETHRAGLRRCKGTSS